MVDQGEAGAKTVLHPRTTIISSIKTLPDHLNYRVLHEKYVEKRLSVREIARQLSSSKTTILDALKKLDIPLRLRNSSERPSNPPYGLRHHKGLFVEDKAETRVIQKIIIPKYQHGEALTAIARFLDAQGIKSKTGTHWHHQVIRAILRREGVFKSRRPSLQVPHKTKSRNVKKGKKQ